MTSPGAHETAVDRALLRRIERIAILGVLAAAAACVLAGQPDPALALTLGGAASIVGFRSLQGLVGRLHASQGGRVGCAGSLGLLLRSTVLAGFILTLLAFGSEDILALLVGVSAIPLAVTIEAGRALMLARSGDERHG